MGLMGLTFFESTDDSTFVEKPFIDEYVKTEGIVLEPLQVLEVFQTRKKSGYILSSHECLVFMYNKSKVLQQLLEALNVYVSSSHGYKLYIVPQEKDPYYKLAIDPDKPTNWLYTKGKWHVSELNTSTSESNTENPFLPIPRTGRHKK